MSRGHKVVASGLIVLAVIAVCAVVSESVLLLAPQLITSRFGAALPWPVACTVRGCVSSQAVIQLTTAQAAFARTISQPPVGSDVVLTTLIREYLVHQALPAGTVSQTDITNYRTDVLHLTDAATIQHSTGLTLPQYEQLVIRPFLEQEALKELRKSNTLEDLFHGLAQEQRVLVLPKGFHWDRDKAAVTKT